MKLKFLGGYKRLKKCVSHIDIDGQWRELKNGLRQFHAESGAVLNWWECSGTIQFQGRDPEMEFEQAFISIASAKGRLVDKHTEQPNGVQEENATLRKLIQTVLVENAKLRRRHSKPKERVSEKQ
jgi:hypothetical protein